jgi:hypothetical protein
MCLRHRATIPRIASGYNTSRPHHRGHEIGWVSQIEGGEENAGHARNSGENRVILRWSSFAHTAAKTGQTTDAMIAVFNPRLEAGRLDPSLPPRPAVEFLL